MLLWLMLPLALASLLWFNRHAKYDVWAIDLRCISGHYLARLARAFAQAALGRSLLGIGGTGWDHGPASTTVRRCRYRTRGVRCRAEPDSVHVAPEPGHELYGSYLVQSVLDSFPVLLVVNAWSSRYLTASTASGLGGLLMAYLLAWARAWSSITGWRVGFANVGVPKRHAARGA